MKNSADTQKQMLRRIESLVRRDDRIVGLWVVGSLATEKADKYSDVDVYVLVEKENYAEVFGERASFAEKIGRVLSSFEVEWPNCQLYGVVMDNFVEVDLCYCRPEQVEIFGPYKILVDKKGNLQELLAKHTVGYDVDVKKRLLEHVDFGAYNLLHAINMLGRGEYWSSIRQVEMLRKRTVSLVGLRTHSDVEEEYRKLELLLSEEMNRALQETLCSYDFGSIAKAIRAVTVLFMQEAKEPCKSQNLSFPSGKFERLLEYLEKIRSERENK